MKVVEWKESLIREVKRGGMGGGRMEEGGMDEKWGMNLWE